VLNNTSTPQGFLASGGLDDALQVLRNYNKQVIGEANKAREIEEDVILALTGLRSDLHQKIKEIRNLSGDFKNTVEKEMDATRRAVNHLQDALGQTDLDPALTTGKQDPYLLRLAADRQLERQIEEENYLHQVSIRVNWNLYFQLTCWRIGLPQLGKLGPGAGVDRCWRDSEIVQCVHRDPQTGGRCCV
jgi:hypothetical protein